MSASKSSATALVGNGPASCMNLFRGTTTRVWKWVRLDFASLATVGWTWAL